MNDNKSLDSHYQHNNVWWWMRKRKKQKYIKKKRKKMLKEIYFCKVHESVHRAINQPQKCSLGAIKLKYREKCHAHGYGFVFVL